MTNVIKNPPTYQKAVELCKFVKAAIKTTEWPPRVWFKTRLYNIIPLKYYRCACGN